MTEYLALADHLVERIEGINARLEQGDMEALHCLRIAIADVEMYLRGLNLMQMLNELREVEA